MKISAKSILQKNYLFPAVFFFLAVLFFFSDIFLSHKIYFQRDLTLLFQPWAQFAKEEIVSGRGLPLWNPYTNCGMPFMANMQSGIFYPPNILFYALNFVSALRVYIFLHFLATLLFMYFLLLDFNLKKSSSIIGALAWSFSGAVVAKIEFLSIIGTIVWLPLEFLIVRKQASPGGFRGAVKYTALLALVISFQFFAGHPQEFFYSFSFIAVYVVFEMITGRNTGILKRFIVSSLLAFLIVAVQLLPSAELIINSRRFINKNGIGMNMEDAAVFSYKTSYLKNIITPLLEKNGIVSKFSGMDLENQWIEMNYVGIAGFFLALTGLFALKGRIKYFLLFMILVTGALSLGHNFFLYKFLYSFMLPMRFIRHPATLMYIAVFGMSVFAAFGANKIKEPRLTSLIALFILFELYFYKAYVLTSINGSIFEKKGENIEFLLKNNGLHRFALTPLSRQQTRTHDSDLFSAYTKYKDKLFGNVNINYRIFNFYGQDMETRDFYTYLNRAFTKSSIDEAEKLLSLANVKYVLSYREINSPRFRLVHKGEFNIYENTGFLPRFLMVNKAKIMSKEESMGYIESYGFNPLKEVVIDSKKAPGVLKYEDSVGGKITGRAEVINYKPGYIEVSASAVSPSYLLVLDAYYPGWKVYIDGNLGKIYRADFLFMAVQIPAGKHSVKFSYNPLFFKIGMMMSLLGMVFTVVFLLRGKPNCP